MTAPWTATVLTLFPEMFPGPLGHSLAGKALARGIWRLETVDIRGYARDKHRSVDDAPFGGGPGMSSMRPSPGSPTFRDLYFIFRRAATGSIRSASRG